MGASFVAVTGGGLPIKSNDISGARARIADAVGVLAPYAREFGVSIAVEALHPMLAAEHGAICTLRQALDICDAAGEGAGILIDTYHSWWEPDLEALIKCAGRRILGLQVADWLVPTTRVAHSRGMPGEGIIDNRSICRWAKEAGFAGPVEYEIFSADKWWTKYPDAILEEVLESLASWR
jgi:sugar phosphate isomerase/epimerase